MQGLSGLKLKYQTGKMLKYSRAPSLVILALLGNKRSCEFSMTALFYKAMMWAG
jgi:hypothetical protein